LVESENPKMAANR